MEGKQERDTKVSSYAPLWKQLENYSASQLSGGQVPRSDGKTSSAWASVTTSLKGQLETHNLETSFQRHLITA